MLRLLQRKKQSGKTKKPGALILVRHGESLWNANSTFTGWADPDLSRRGERENEHAARLLLAAGYKIDIAYTSRLTRAIMSTWIILRELDQIYRPVFKSWRLNERFYGALTGLSKPGLAIELGEDRVQNWRHGLRDRPPPMSPNHSYWPGRERRYADLPTIPASESLEDTMVRTMPLWTARIEKDLLDGNNVMIVAHGNSLRGILKYVDNISDDDIVDVSIPNGIPLVYKFDVESNGDRHRLTPIVAPNAISPLSGEFLEKKGALRAALARENELMLKIPGFQADMASVSPAMRSLAKLELERKMIELSLTEQPQPSTFNSDDDGTFHSAVRGVVTPTEEPPNVEDAFYMGFPASGMMAITPATTPKDTTTDPSEVSDDNADSAIDDASEDDASKSFLTSLLTSTSTRSEQTSPPEEDDGRGPLIIIIRHGKTTANQLGLFTGWEDVPLAAEGRAEAKKAGELLRRHGIELDVVYTSWLSRAIETAWMVLTELDSLWIPLVKSWRLNERHYGQLTGLSKKMIAQIHGEAQFKKWRRGYTQRPPPVSSFSQYYPGNDERYVKYVTDLEVSIRESIVRTFADGRLTLARNLPKCESLKDCMDRTIPFYTQIIAPVARRRNVLIASSENAIRGLLMHLCDLPPDRISEVEIPTGLPLVYSPRMKCLRLLDDGNYATDPSIALRRHDFGLATDLLFKPCDPEKSDFCEVDDYGNVSLDPIIRLPPAKQQVLPPQQQQEQQHHRPSLHDMQPATSTSSLYGPGQSQQQETPADAGTTPPRAPASSV